METKRYKIKKCKKLSLDVAKTMCFTMFLSNLMVKNMKNTVFLAKNVKTIVEKF